MYYPLDQFRLRTDVRAFSKVVDASIEKKYLTQQAATPIARDAVMSRLRALGYARSALPSLMQAVFAEVQGLLVWGQWRVNGSKIIDVAPALTRALHLSDCGDLIIEDLIPDAAIRASTAFYVRFGGAHDIVFSERDLNKKVSLEGAYVVLDAQSIRIVLCGSMPASTPAHERWRERYDLRIPSSLYAMPVKEAVIKSLAIDLEDLAKAHDAMEDAASRALVKQWADRMTANHADWCEAVYLIANLLAWLKHLPDDFEDGWPDGAPVRLVNQLKSGTAREQARARSKLWSAGFIPIERVGLRFEREFRLERSVSQHIRRGHWRNQAHGPGFSLRKLIWMLPMIVGVAK